MCPGRLLWSPLGPQLPKALVSCHFLNDLFRPSLLPVSRSWLWELAGWAAWYHGQSWGDMGEDWDWAPLFCPHILCL